MQTQSHLTHKEHCVKTYTFISNSSCKHQGQLCAEVNQQNIEDGNHLLLCYKVSQASQGKLHAYMKEFLYSKIRKHSGHGLMSVTIHNCRDQIWIPRWFTVRKYLSKKLL